MRTDPDVDATLVVAATVAVTTAVDADCPLLETVPADVTSCGSSFFCVPAAMALDATTDVMDVETQTAAGSSLSSCFFAVDVETAADADLKCFRAEGVLPSVPFYIPVLF